MSRPALQGSLPVVFVGALLMLACGGAGSAESSTSAGAGEHAGGAGATAAGGASQAGSGGVSDSARAGSGNAAAASGGADTAAGGASGAVAGSTSGGGGSAGSAASTPGAGLDCASNDGSPLCAAGLLATRPCSFGPRVSACVCMAPCDSAADCGGASCVDIALISGTKGSVCPPPDYTCAAP